MPGSHEPRRIRSDNEAVEFVLGQMRSALERERDRIHQEIRSYPLPIPACDEQFNHLLERRSRLSRELARLSQVARTSPSQDSCLGLLDELAEASDLVADDLHHRLRACLCEQDARKGELR